MRYQLPLSQNRGGLGLRPPVLFEPAAKISSLSGKSKLIARFFLFHFSFNTNLINLNSNTNNGINNIGNNNNNNNNNINAKIVSQLQQFENSQNGISKYDSKVSKHLNSISLEYNSFMATKNINKLLSMNLIYNKIITFYHDRVKQAILRFTDVTENMVQYDPMKHRSHRQLVDLVDLYLLRKFYQDNSIMDSARLKCLSNNGSISWLHVPYDVHYGKQFTNREFILAKSLILGQIIII